MRDLVHQYYEAWAAQNSEPMKELLAADLKFISPQACFDSADSFLTHCWILSKGLKGLEFEEEIYDQGRAFVILRWLMEDGSCFVDAEYLDSSRGKISKIIVLNNSPEFSQLMEDPKD